MKKFWLTFLLCVATFSVLAQEQETIVLKAMLVNPSEDETQVVPLELPLPREVTKKDIAELSEGLEIFYDSEQGVCVAKGEISLNPSEEKKITVKINDIWRVPEKNIKFQQGYLPALVKSVEGTKYENTARQLSESIHARLENVISTQNEPLSPSKHIALYRENLAVMTDIRKDISFLEKLSSQTSSLSPDAIEVEDDSLAKGAPSQTLATITLKMSIKNPSMTEKSVLPFDYNLPREVRESDVISAGELEVRYDLNLGVVGVHKNEVELAPGEVKTFEVVVRDVWKIEPEIAQELQVKAAGYEKGLEGTIFEDSAVKIVEEVSKLANQIVQNQSKAEGQPIDEHIAVHIENLSLLSQMKENIKKMARIEAVSAVTPEATPQSLGLELPEGEAEAGVSDTPGKKGPQILAQTIFAGKAIEESTIWRLIMIIIGFLGLMSLLFYLLWWAQVRLEKDIPESNLTQKT